MKKIELKNGLKLEVDESALDDMVFVDMLAEAQNSPIALPGLFATLIGEDGKKALYESLKNDKGRVPVASAYAAIKEIMESLGEKGKN